jgi:hypothetical protein
MPYLRLRWRLGRRYLFKEKAGKLSTVPCNPPEKEQYILEM